MHASMNRFSIGSNNGFSSIRTKPLSKLLLGTNFIEILIEIQNILFPKMHLKIWAVKWWPFCPGEILPFYTFISEQNGCHITDDSFNCNFLDWKFCLFITISLKFVGNLRFSYIGVTIIIFFSFQFDTFSWVNGH